MSRANRNWPRMPSEARFAVRDGRQLGATCSTSTPNGFRWSGRCSAMFSSRVPRDPLCVGVSSWTSASRSNPRRSRRWSSNRSGTNARTCSASVRCQIPTDVPRARLAGARGGRRPYLAAQHGDAVLLQRTRLADDLVEDRRGQEARVEQVAQDVAGADRRELVVVADEHDRGAAGRSPPPAVGASRAPRRPCRRAAARGVPCPCRSRARSRRRA